MKLTKSDLKVLAEMEKLITHKDTRDMCRFVAVQCVLGVVELTACDGFYIVRLSLEMDSKDFEPLAMSPAQLREVIQAECYTPHTYSLGLMKSNLAKSTNQVLGGQVQATHGAEDTKQIMQAFKQGTSVADTSSKLCCGLNQAGKRVKEKCFCAVLVDNEGISFATVSQDGKTYGNTGGRGGASYWRLVYNVAAKNMLQGSGPVTVKLTKQAIIVTRGNVIRASLSVLPDWHATETYNEWFKKC